MISNVRSGTIFAFRIIVHNRPLFVDFRMKSMTALFKTPAYKIVLFACNGFISASPLSVKSSSMNGAFPLHTIPRK